MAELHIPVRMNPLCCRICNAVLRNPATIPCGHNFCMQCIQDYWDQEESKSLPHTCPECGWSFSSRPRLIKNTALADLVRGTGRGDKGSEKRKQQQCSEESVKRPHSCTVSGTSRGFLCWRHNKLLNVYCCTDEKIICEECASAEHGGHTFGLVVEERRRKQKELESIKTKFKQILQKQEVKRKNLRKALEQIEEEARQTDDYCESVLAGVIDCMQRHYQSVKQLIGAQEDAVGVQAQQSLHKLEQKMEEIRKRETELDRLAQTDSDAYFLQEWPSLHHLCEEDHLQAFHEVSEDPLLPFKSIKKAVEQLGKQLEAICDKDFVSVSQTVAKNPEQHESEGETEENNMQEGDEESISQSYGLCEVNTTVAEQMEPRTRAEFLQYACELTLDPATAHEDLLLSKEHKEVRLCPQKCKSAAIRYPERFVHRRQVLCKQGLQAECCYYEVEVHGDKAEIALAYKGIDRKSRTKVSAFGGNVNSWSLDRSTNYSVSHRGDSIQLTTSPSCHTIGVYLKFKEGTLSFYEVSESMKFLYKVEAEFTEPLYPGFWLGEKSCIRISDLRQKTMNQ